MRLRSSSRAVDWLSAGFLALATQGGCSPHDSGGPSTYTNQDSGLPTDAGGDSIRVTDSSDDSVSQWGAGDSALPFDSGSAPATDADRDSSDASDERAEGGPRIEDACSDDSTVEGDCGSPVAPADARGMDAPTEVMSADAPVLVFDAADDQESGPAPPTPIIDHIWPSTQAASGPLLIEGRNLDGVQSLEIEGLSTPVSVFDTTDPMHEKAVATMPADVVATDTAPISLTTATQTIPQGGFYIVAAQRTIDGPIAPVATFAPVAVEAFPPVSDDWLNECDQADAEGYLVGAADEDGSITSFSGADPNVPLSGVLNATDGLVYMTATKDGSTHSYVGVFSATATAVAERIVFFPTDEPAGQLIWIVCFDTDCPTWLADDDSGVPLAQPVCPAASD